MEEENKIELTSKDVLGDDQPKTLGEDKQIKKEDDVPTEEDSKEVLRKRRKAIIFMNIFCVV